MSAGENLKHEKTVLAVIGLGYVGLPLAVEFGKAAETIAFDTDISRVDELRRGFDRNGEISEDRIRAARKTKFTGKARDIAKAGFIIAAVPTSVTKNKTPDLSHITSAARLIGENISKGAVVVLESTVYPGVTEDIFAPEIARHSGLVPGRDFKIGYSPERINPGDREHTLGNVVKIVSACDEETLEKLAAVYGLVVKAGVYRAPSIKCAEAAKVIENTQRDLNIALMNELSIIFHKMGIDTKSVLEAAGTKWNFIKMHPGLVGGHCIGVDPYYLTHKAEEIGYHPQVILAGRKINDFMGKYIGEQTVKKLIEAGKTVKGSKALICGFTFKENISDTRNTRVIDIIKELEEFGLEVMVCDPVADGDSVEKEYGFRLTPYSPELKADCLILAVAHDRFIETLKPETVAKHLANGRGRGVVIDVKGVYEPDDFKGRDLLYWRL